jgi:hypothetical protein
VGEAARHQWRGKNKDQVRRCRLTGGRQQWGCGQWQGGGVCFIGARMRAMRSQAERVKARHDSGGMHARTRQRGGFATVAVVATTAMTRREATRFGARRLSMQRWRARLRRGATRRKGMRHVVKRVCRHAWVDKLHYARGGARQWPRRRTRAGAIREHCAGPLAASAWPQHYG